MSSSIISSSSIPARMGGTGREAFPPLAYLQSPPVWAGPGRRRSPKVVSPSIPARMGGTQARRLFWRRHSFNPRPYGRDKDANGATLGVAFNPRPYGRDSNCFSLFEASLDQKMERDYQVSM